MVQISEAEKHAKSGQVVISSEVLAVLRDRCTVTSLSKNSFSLNFLDLSSEVGCFSDKPQVGSIS